MSKLSNYTGSIELISGITQKNNGDFPLVQASDVMVENNGKTLDVKLDEVTGKVAEIYDLINTTPKLAYSDQDGYKEGQKMYYSIGDAMNLIFSFSSSSAGKCTITILRNGVAFKNATVNKGVISIDLGKATASGKYVYTVSGIDAIGRDADNTLTFTHIVGGVELSSTFDAVIKNTVFSANKNNNITVPYSISYPEEGYERIIDYSIINSNSTIITSGSLSCGNLDKSSSFIIDNVNFGTSGTYNLLLTGKVKISDETILQSTQLKYTFSVIENNSIAIALLDTVGNVTTDDAIFISYRIVTNIDAISGNNQLAARCVLYSIDDDNIEKEIKSIRISNLSSGDTESWAIGRLPNSGKYKYVITGEPMGGSNSGILTKSAEETFIVANGSSIGSSYETNGLIAFFDANDMDNGDANPSVWKAKNSQSDNYYYFKLHNLNYQKNGWIMDDDGSKMLKFTGDSYGELRHVDSRGNDAKYSPISEMTSSSLGNSLEIVFKSRCIGVSDAVVMSCRNEAITNYGGYSVYYDSAKVSSNSQNATVDLVEEKETHIVFVIDKNIRELGKDVDNSNIEDMNPTRTMNIYVNGVRTKVITITDTEAFANTSAYPSIQMILNAYYDAQNDDITGFGSCEIKTIRLYNTALKATQVLNNYINSKYNINERKKLVNKNDSNKADIPIVRFVRNKIIDESNNVSYGKYSKDKSFATLNSITLKSSKDPNVATSKNSWVNCTMWYTYLNEDGLWNTVSYPDVDVYLQGTSSLQYPIKNYKIKLFNSNASTTTRGGKNKIIPPNKINKNGWYVAESTFTLKCDYMEESHKNNTPTAMLYEEILDKVMVSVGSTDYTPAKRDSYEKCYVTYKKEDENGNEIDVTERRYRDAVAGFPILLYYNENDDVDINTNMPIDYNTLSNTSDGYYVNNKDVMVGTLMFNIDKTDDTLGFKVSKEAGPVQLPISGGNATYTDGSEVTLDIMPCVSLEGTSNSSKPSAASFYTMAEANKYTYEDDYLIPQYNALGLNTSYNDFYENVQNSNYLTIYTYDQYCQLDNTGIFKNVYDYISATFDARWVYTEESIDSEKKLSDEVFNELTYGHIKQTIDWLDTCYTNKTKFRNEFSQHFNLAYCITYYLQMMMFIQVDNAGKNAMFDEWGDGILYPRPYDMDTQMGENNSGDDVIHTSAEINVALSPSGITGTYASQASASNSSTDKNHNRYIDYNTPNSKLWITFGNFFRAEIVAAYTKLRTDKIYDTDHIISTVNSLTSDIIGESFYNKDAAAKYLTQTKYITNANGTISISDAMLTKLQGNRDCAYEYKFKERIIFLDTFFGYTEGNTINKSITIRSDAISAGTSNVPVGISVYSPCYITIQVGTDVTICAYIDKNESYQYNGNEYEGVLFNLPIVANNKDIIILGAGNIKSINHMENLVVTNFICEEAKKLTSIVITNSTALASLSLGANIYLRTLNVSGSETLSGSLTLSNCSNLRYVDISNTDVSSIILPEGGDLQQFIAKNCKLTTLTFNDLQFLNNIDIEGCTTIVSYDINNCPLITEINTAGWTSLNRIVVSNCKNVTTLTLNNTNISEMSITSCDNINSINLSNCSGRIMSNLNLSTVYGLSSLNISGSNPSDGIIVYLPLYKSEYSSLQQSEINDLINTGTDVYWHGLKTFNAESSTLKNISYGIQTGLVSGVLDFSKLTGLTTFNIKSCYNIKEILNINYTGALNSLFYNDRSLTKITGTLTATTTDCSYIFFQCYALNNISGVVFNLNTITNASNVFRRCYAITYQSIKYLLSSLYNVTNLSWALCQDGGTSVYTIEDNTLFENNTKVTNLDGIFASSKITSVPDGIFDYMKDTLTSLNYAFHSCSSLVTVNNNIFKNLSKLTTVRECFKNSSVKTLFSAPNYYNIFPDSSLITDTRSMFTNCTSLTAASGYTTNNVANGLKQMFNNLTKLTNAETMFYNTRFITSLPETIFENATKLVEIDAMFAESTSITSLPDALFSNQGNAVITHPNLIGARGLFSGCTSCAGTIKNTLLHGANNLQYIGQCNGYICSGWSNTAYYTGGMFANTKVSGYAYNFLHHLTKLKSVSMLFYHGTCTSSSMVPSSSHTNSSTLSYVYIGDMSYPQRIYHDIFKGLTNLKDVSYCFAGNTSLYGFVDSYGNDVNSQNPNGNTEINIFKDCKSTLLYAEGLFTNCSNLEILVSSSLFKNCISLITLSNAFAMCTKINGSLPSDFLSGCKSLAYTQYMFYNCKELGSSDLNNDISVHSTIFDSCRKVLANTSYMFAGCGFQGQIQSGSGTQTTSTNDDGITMTTYTITRNGLLSECTKLITTEGMFKCCYRLKGAIPEDLFFTSEAQNLYSSLTNISYMFDCCYKLGMSSEPYGIDARNKRLIYGTVLSTSDKGYLVPQNWLNRCPNLTTIAYLFNHVGDPQSGETDAEFYVCKTDMDDNTLSQQTKIQDANHAFSHCKSLNANLTSTFMQNCLNTLTNAQRMFAFSNIISIGTMQYYALFEKNSSTTAKNTTLKNIEGLLYYANNNNMTGYGPTMSRLSAITSSNYMIYNQTKISNYSNYSANQKSSTTYYSDSDVNNTNTYSKIATLRSNTM